MNFLKRILLFLCCTSILVGCSAKPQEITIQDIMELDWTQIANAVDDKFVNDQYPMNSSVNYNLDTDNNIFSLVIIVNDGTTAKEAVKSGEDAIKGINDLANKQNKNIKKSGKNFYGGFYGNLDLQLQIIPDSPYTSEDRYIVDQMIPAGEYVEIEAREIPKLENPVDEEVPSESISEMEPVDRTVAP